MKINYNLDIINGVAELFVEKEKLMEQLKQYVRQKGKVIGEEILKVDSFLNHQMDISLFQEIGKEIKRRFQEEEVTKILTVEASGIGVACITAQYFDNVPVVFAKKFTARNLNSQVYESKVYSFTKDTFYSIRVDKNYLTAQDKVLIVDDFLANGNAVLGLIDIIRQSGAQVAGVAIVIEKSFQEGRAKILEQQVKLESLARIQSLHNGQIKFAE